MGDREGDEEGDGEGDGKGDGKGNGKRDGEGDRKEEVTRKGEMGRISGSEMRREGERDVKEVVR